MGTNITIAMALGMLTVWFGRLKAILESIKHYKRTKDTRELKPLLKVLKLFAFDIAVTIGTIIIVGEPNSIFAYQFIIACNFLTTIGAELFFRVSSWYSENLRKESMKEAEYAF